MKAPLLSIEDLRIAFEAEDGRLLEAVSGVSLAVGEGETVGLVGESGCGKSVTALSVLRLVPSPPSRRLGGRILFRGEDLLTLPPERLRAIRGKEISVVFQDPMTSLSPLRRLGDQLAETVLLHEKVSRKEALAKAEDWLGRVGLPEPARLLKDFPHQISGGMQQRVMIASALILDPALVIADEPTTALDANLQAQVLDLMKSAKGAETALLLITHDMGVVRRVADRVAVMYAGEIVEEAPVGELFASPRHPYTRALLAARPSLETRGKRLAAIPGTVPSLGEMPEGCRFRPRCASATAACGPVWNGGGHFVRCSGGEGAVPDGAAPASAPVSATFNESDCPCES